MKLSTIEKILNIHLEVNGKNVDGISHSALMLEFVIKKDKIRLLNKLYKKIAYCKSVCDAMDIVTKEKLKFGGRV